MQFIVDEENKRRKLRDEFQNAVAQTRQKKALEKQVAECTATFKHCNAELKRIEAVVAAMSTSKAFSPEMLGFGRKSGGLIEHKKNRYECLERLRRIGNLTDAQKGQWDFFKTQWDNVMANERGVNWGQEFAEILQEVSIKMLRGDSDAFSNFVKDETDRKLGGTGAFVAPGFWTATAIGEASF